MSESKQQDACAQIKQNYQTLQDHFSGYPMPPLGCLAPQCVSIHPYECKGVINICQQLYQPQIYSHMDAKAQKAVQYLCGPKSQ
jgi:hypothetical protein